MALYCFLILSLFNLKLLSQEHGYNKHVCEIQNYNKIHVIINTIEITKNIGGGVSIFIDIYNIIDSLCTSIDGFIDIVTVNITITNKNIMVRGIYKSHQANIINFSDFIYCNFNIFSSKYTLFLVCDFNINLLEKKIK